jgi:hypothetical protein
MTFQDVIVRSFDCCSEICFRIDTETLAELSYVCSHIHGAVKRKLRDRWLHWCSNVKSFVPRIFPSYYIHTDIHTATAHRVWLPGDLIATSFTLHTNWTHQHNIHVELAAFVKSIALPWSTYRVLFADGTERLWTRGAAYGCNDDHPDWAHTHIHADTFSLCDCCHISFPAVALASTCFRFDEIDHLTSNNKHAVPIIIDSFTIGLGSLGAFHAECTGLGDVRLDILEMPHDRAPGRGAMICIIRDIPRRLSEIAKTLCGHIDVPDDDRYIVAVRMQWYCSANIAPRIHGRRSITDVHLCASNPGQRIPVYALIHPNSHAITRLTDMRSSYFAWNMRNHDSAPLSHGRTWAQRLRRTISVQQDWTTNDTVVAVNAFGTYPAWAAMDGHMLIWNMSHVSHTVDYHLDDGSDTVICVRRRSALTDLRDHIQGRTVPPDFLMVPVYDFGHTYRYVNHQVQIEHTCPRIRFIQSLTF